MFVKCILRWVSAQNEPFSLTKTAHFFVLQDKSVLHADSRGVERAVHHTHDLVEGGTALRDIVFDRAGAAAFGEKRPQRIGKRLAWKLHTLGAAVTVAARRPEALALARILGLQAEPLGPQLRGLAVYDAVVNTVPAPVICDVQLSAIRPDAALLELASLPGGFCPAAAERAGYLAARGLPGVYAPEAAAAVIRRAIFRELDLEECP